MLVGGESKLGSTEHDPMDDGDMTKFQLHSHVQSITMTTTNGLYIGATLAIPILRVPTGFMD